MNSTIKIVIAASFSACLFAASQASASYQPDYCRTNHDHRSHDANYYDYYDKDEYYRAGDYRGNRSYRRDRSYNRGHNRGYRRYRPRSRVVFRREFPTRYDAYVVIVEEIYYTRSGREQLVCSAVAKGYDRRYISYKRMRRLANRHCSRRARIQYL